MMDNEKENLKEVFACPSCGTEVDVAAATCPGCNAIFEEEGHIPPPPDSLENQVYPTSNLVDQKSPLPPEGPPKPMASQLNMGALTSDKAKQQNPPLSHGQEAQLPHLLFRKHMQEFQSSKSNKPNVPLPHGMDEHLSSPTPETKEQQAPSPSEIGEQPKKSPPEIEEQQVPLPSEIDGQLLEPPPEIEGHVGPLPDGMKEPIEPPPELEEPQAPLPSEMEEPPIEPPTEIEEPQPPPPSDMTQWQIAQSYNTGQQQAAYQYTPSPSSSAIPLQYSSGENNRGYGLNQQVTQALKDYADQRRKRNLLGALFMGTGLVLFVLLWLVVVYDVLVTETSSWFGFDIMLILVCAGLFFILGLYLILTYPKSSLADVFASTARA